jgi:hypothetical protein
MNALELGYNRSALQTLTFHTLDGTLYQLGRRT